MTVSLPALRAAIAVDRAEILDITQYVHEHPELAYEEHAAADRLVAALSEADRIERPYAGMPTAFRAEFDGTAPGPTVAIVAVYDAVGVPSPDGGMTLLHSCGHGPIAGGAAGAARALARFRSDFAGTLVVLGMPADELVSPLAIDHGSGKAAALGRGGWDGIDAAIYAHPESHTGVWRASRWMQLIEAELPGDVDPRSWDLPFDRYRIDRVVRAEGATRAVVRVLGDDGDELGERARLARERIAPSSWTPLWLTQGLTADAAVAAAAEAALTEVGLAVETPPTMPFSTDFGNVARHVPGAMIGIARDGGWAVHTEEGERQFRSPEGEELAVCIAEVLSASAARLLRQV
ncbi:MAG: M20/M25/M40 family metallo-hydrolase [Chloroflexi bacterium]|nr:M20/M25/M40 family metallo-hydrolase [Chloroflexota bacterium]